jgi:hypothetical protein
MDAGLSAVKKSLDLLKYDDADRDYDAFSRIVASETSPDILGSEAIALHALLMHLVEELTDPLSKITTPIFPEGVRLAPRAISVAKNNRFDMNELLRQYFLVTLSVVGMYARKNDRSLQAGDVSVGTVLDYDDTSNPEDWLGRMLFPTDEHPWRVTPGTKHDAIDFVSNTPRVQLSYEREFTLKRKNWLLKRVKAQLVNLCLGMIYVITALYTWYSVKHSQSSASYFVKHNPLAFLVGHNKPFSLAQKITGDLTWPTYDALLDIWQEIMSLKWHHRPVEFTCYKGLIVLKSSETINISVGTSKKAVVEKRRLLALVKDPTKLEGKANRIGLGGNATIYNIGMKDMVMKISLFDEDARTEMAMFNFIQQAGISHIAPTVLPRYVIFTGRFHDNIRLFVAQFMQKLDRTLKDHFTFANNEKPLDQTDSKAIYDVLFTFENHGFIHHDMHPGNIISKYSVEEGQRKWLLIDFGNTYYTGPDPLNPQYPYGFNFVTNKLSTPSEMYPISWTRFVLPRPIPRWDLFCLISYFTMYSIPMLKSTGQEAYHKLFRSFVEQVIRAHPAMSVFVDTFDIERVRYRTESFGVPTIIIDPNRRIFYR